MDIKVGDRFEWMKVGDRFEWMKVGACFPGKQYAKPAPYVATSPINPNGPKVDRDIAAIMEQKNAEYVDRHKQAIKDAWAATSQLWTPPATAPVLSRGMKK